MLLAAVFQAWPTPNPAINKIKRFTQPNSALAFTPSIIFGNKSPRPTYNHLLKQGGLNESKSLSLPHGISTDVEEHLPSATQPLLSPENSYSENLPLVGTENSSHTSFAIPSC